MPITRSYGDLRVELVGPVVSRVFNPQNAIADRMKHVIEPNFSVQRRTEIDNQDRIPTRAGAYDTIVGGTTQMNYGLTNRLLVRKDAQGEPAAGAPRELLNVSVRQSYYTDANASKFDTSYSYGYANRDPNTFSPISLTARATPTQPLAIDYRLEYDPVPEDEADPKLLGMSLNGTLRSAIADVTRRLEPAGLRQRRSDDQRQPPDPKHDEPANPQLRRHRHLQLRHRPIDAAQPALHRLLQRAVLRRLVRIPVLQLSQQPQLPPVARPPLQHVVHAGRGGLVLKLLRGVRRRDVLRSSIDMKGLILSGGKGTRLRPLTYTSAKQLVPVANKPVLFYGVEALVAAGITDIGVVVGDTHAEIRAALGDGSQFGARVTYIPQDAPRGLAHAVLITEEFIGTDPFVMYLGDNLLNRGIGSFVEQFVKEKPAAQILLTPVPDPQMFGVAELKNDKVVRLVEKPKEPKSNLALVGVYMFGPEIFTSVKRIKPSFRNELEITDAIQDLIDRGLRVTPHMVSGWWKDTGKLEDMLEANRLILETLTPRVEGKVDAASRIEGNVVIEAGATVEHSVIRGPAIIGPGAKITHAYVGPFTSIGRDVEISRSEIEHSIVLEGSLIHDLETRVADSLIGRGVKIHRLQIKPVAHRFMLGDNSEVWIKW